MVTVSDIMAKIFEGTLDAVSFSSRAVVVDYKVSACFFSVFLPFFPFFFHPGMVCGVFVAQWVTDYLRGFLTGKIPVGELIVNEKSDGTWHLIKGKQKLSALLAFFSSRISIRWANGEIVRWSDSREDAWGYSQILKIQYRSSHAPPVHWRFQFLFRELEAALRNSPAANMELMEESDERCTRYVSKTENDLLGIEIPVYVMADWSNEAAIYTGIWWRMMNKPTDKHEILHMIPNVRSLKVLEPRTTMLCDRFGISTANRIPFYLMLKAYAYISGSRNVSCISSRSDLDSIALVLIKDFVNTKRRSQRSIEFKACQIKLGISNLTKIRERIFGDNRVYPVKKVTMDCFVALLVASSYLMTIDTHNTIVKSFKFSTVKRMALIGKQNNEDFNTGKKYNNLSKCIRSIIKKP